MVGREPIFGFLVLHLFKVLLDQVEERKKEEERIKKRKRKRRKRRRRKLGFKVWLRFGISFLYFVFVGVVILFWILNGGFW